MSCRREPGSHRCHLHRSGGGRLGTRGRRPHRRIPGTRGLLRRSPTAVGPRSGGRLPRHRCPAGPGDQDAGPIWQGDGLVFTTQFGTPVEPRNFNRSWDSRIAKAKIRKITVHDGRRTCATLLVDLDIHPRQVMRILRHAQFAVTMEIYAQASRPRRRGRAQAARGQPR
jgi:integrase